MRNLRLIKDPREHFSIFWKEQSQDDEVRLAELQEGLRELVRQIQGGQFLSRCATIELLPLPVEPSNREVSELLSNERPGVGSPSPKKVPGTYWVVPSDVLEVALLTYEITQQQLKLEQQEKTRLTQLLDEQTG